ARRAHLCPGVALAGLLRKFIQQTLADWDAGDTRAPSATGSFRPSKPASERDQLRNAASRERYSSSTSEIELSVCEISSRTNSRHRFRIREIVARTATSVMPNFAAASAQVLPSPSPTRKDCNSLNTFGRSANSVSNR